MLDRMTIDRWRTGRHDLALDYDGPVDVAFEPFAEAWLERPIVERFEHVAERHADKIAVADDERRLTYRELRRTAYHLAARIQALVPAGCPVGILLPSNALFPAAALACLAAGRPYVPLDPTYPAARIGQIVREAGITALIIDRVAGRVSYAAGALPNLDIGSSLDAPEIAFLTARAHGPAVILYTSGSTGRPKGICNDQRAILQRVAQATNSCHLNADDRIVLMSSPGTIAGVRETFAALLNGATLYPADPVHLGINGVLETVAEARATVAYAVPVLLRRLLDQPSAGHAFRELRVIRTGGDIPIAADLALCRAVLPATCHVLIAFSSTEVPTIFQWFVPQAWPPDSARLPIGYARPDMSFAVIDEAGSLVADGEAGELVLKSRYLALGYWQDGQLQAGPFRTDSDDPAERVLHTGDLVRVAPDGLIRMEGRKDRQIKIRGSRVDLGDVEAALRGCAGVADAAVIARRRGEEVVSLVAYVVPRDRDSASFAGELKGALAERLPWRMRPGQIRFLDAIPQLRGFKPDVKALEKLDRGELGDEAAPAEPQDNGTADLPAETLEARRIRDAVEEAWTTVLDRASFRANRSWDDAGGDSLSALHLWCLIENKLGQRLAIESLEADATPSALIEAIAAQLSHPTSYAAATAAAATPLVYFMPPADGDTPIQAQFRAAFHNQIRFEVVQYPQWPEMLDAGGGFDVLVDAAVTQILSTAGSDILLAGYSFGGFVAWEVARRLLMLKRPVRFLGLIDSQRVGDPPPRQGRFERLRNAARGCVANPGETLATMCQRVLGSLAQNSRFGALRLFGLIAAALPAGAGFKLRYHLNYQLRVRSRHRWMFGAHDADTYLFRTDEFSEQAAQASWGGLSSRLTVVPVGGEHLSILRPPAREVLCRQFLNAVNGTR
jgi:amino acid adenylation domain-containing protein